MPALTRPISRAAPRRDPRASALLPSRDRSRRPSEPTGASGYERVAARCSSSTPPRCSSAPSTRCRNRSSAPDGKPVNALLGTANLILREVETHRPRAVVLCFGPDAASYRTELYPAYHADRDEAMPDELAPQWADARAFFEAFGWTVGDQRVARGRRPARHLRPARGRGGRPGAAPDRRPRHVPVRRRAR